jgi:hypothetical protein
VQVPQGRRPRVAVGAAPRRQRGGVDPPGDREGDGPVVVQTGPGGARRLHDEVICSAIVLHGAVRCNDDLLQFKTRFEWC